MNTWLFLSKLMGIARLGVLKVLDVCDFDNIRFWMVTFSFNQTKR